MGQDTFQYDMRTSMEGDKDPPFEYTKKLIDSEVKVG